MGRYGPDSSSSGLEPVLGSHKYVNEISGSKKYLEVLQWLKE
jgi:hypothetical protein